MCLGQYIARAEHLVMRGIFAAAAKDFAVFIIYLSVDRLSGWVT